MCSMPDSTFVVIQKYRIQKLGGAFIMTTMSNKFTTLNIYIQNQNTYLHQYPLAHQGPHLCWLHMRQWAGLWNKGKNVTEVLHKSLIQQLL